VKHRLAFLFVLVVAGAGAMGAWAFLSSPGTGTGSAIVGAVQPVTFAPGTPSDALYPGGSASVTLTVSNPNAGPVFVPSLALDPSQGTNGVSVDGAHSGCQLSDLTFSGNSTGWTIPANAVAHRIDLPNALAMSPLAANACQGATVTVYLKVGP
jgi:hypothetical protein